ncbi:type I secretion system permease/ATPase [Bradyrhizobium manausense]|uniref:type I secretion system permease/ATPase n=1 Tax=Bradyrhizobium manausense TaxID=989370 RepID=UPI001BAB2438|nr:type I secretion system permease/ATPase [Bradyrhizobium manausense]MBR1092292.1 type I secretion system permease/ATPase [Bradyrhizobium manausense]
MQSNKGSTEILEAVRACRAAFVAVGLLSACINVLYLTGSFFMLQVYDRVLTSQNVPTLIGLCVIAAFLYVFQGVLDLLRSRVLTRIGRSVDDALAGRVCEALMRLPLFAQIKTESLQPLRDLDHLRTFLAGAGPSALCDVPWMPMYLLICFVFHFWIGIAACVGGIILLALTIAAQYASRNPAKRVGQLSVSRSLIAERGLRNAEALEAMGMGRSIREIWEQANLKFMDANQQITDITSGLGALTRAWRAALQSGILAIGAYLVIHQEASAGIIIASSILTSRALAPLEMVIAQWKQFSSARMAWTRLNGLLTQVPPLPDRLPLSPPKARLSVEGLVLSPPGIPKVVVSDVGFELSAGQGLGIIGTSASGKSSLVRALVGVWTPIRGKVRLDGAALDQWSPIERGTHIGYLPQDVELFDGSVAQNISRFEQHADPKMIRNAAAAAGVHDMILGLPEGYSTQIGEGGQALSAGQRQRLALARALFRDPFLVVLDEPNSNLDADGEAALTRAVEGIRERGGIVIVVAHRASALAGLDSLLLMANGRLQAFGEKNQVLARLSRPPSEQVTAPAAIRRINTIGQVS